MSDWNDALDAACAVLDRVAAETFARGRFTFADAHEAIRALKRPEKHEPEKRCGTCAEGRPYGHAEVRTPCNHYADSPNRPDGPPWENCRFWKPPKG